jgi:hypothetical protein
MSRQLTPKRDLRLKEGTYQRLKDTCRLARLVDRVTIDGALNAALMAYGVQLRRRARAKNIDPSKAVSGRSAKAFPPERPTPRVY